jgi:type 1 glutamine amidotransferase
MGIWDGKMYGKVGGLAAAAILGSAICANAQAPVNTKLKSILILDKSQGGASGHLESRRDLNAALALLAPKYGFTVTTIGQNDPASKITTEFSATGLAKYQVVLFSNNDGVDAQLDAASKTNFETWVKAGGGFIPIHAASAFISNWPWLTGVLVQSFYGPHGNNQPKANLAHDADGIKDGTETKGIFKGLTAPLAFLDEYYSFQRSPRGTAGVTVLTTVDEKTYSQPVNGPMGTDHPVNWAKVEGKGRVVHMSMGHSWSSNNVYTAANSYLTNFLYGELRYAAGDFLGCMDTKYKEYSPDVTKSDSTACKTLGTTSISVNKSNNGFPVISQMQGKEQIDVNFAAQGAHEVAILDVSGKVMDRRIGNGPAQYSLATPKRAGIYLVKAKAGKSVSTQRITVM